jgi:16S rRNA (guanine966-N2)-methyltransferase
MHIIGGKFRKRKILVPKTTLRPTSSLLRESFFNICRNQIEGSFFLDLFAGSGAMGLEAYSRGASFVTFVDKDRNCFDVIKKNIHLLEMEKFSEVFCLDAKKVLGFLGRKKRKYHIIYIDPPYENAEEEKYITSLLEDIVINDLLEKEGSIFLEKRVSKEKGGKKVFEVEKLHLQETRKFGDSLLVHFNLLDA